MFRDALCWLLCRIHKHSDPVPEGSNRVLWPPWKPPKRLPTADELDFTSDQVAQQVLAEVNYLLIAAKTSGVGAFQAFALGFLIIQVP